MFSEISLPVPSQQMMMLRMGDSRGQGCYLREYSRIWGFGWPRRAPTALRPRTFAPQTSSVKFDVLPSVSRSTATVTSAALVYAINRCTSADSLEYVKSAS